MNQVYIGSTYEATFPYPTDTDESYAFQVMGASVSAVLGGLHLEPVLPRLPP